MNLKRIMRLHNFITIRLKQTPTEIRRRTELRNIFCKVLDNDESPLYDVIQTNQRLKSWTRSAITARDLNLFQLFCCQLSMEKNVDRLEHIQLVI